MIKIWIVGLNAIQPEETEGSVASNNPGKHKLGRKTVLSYGVQ